MPMGPSLLMVMTLELMFLFVLLRTGAQQLLIVLRLQMRTAILYTCIYMYIHTVWQDSCVCVRVCARTLCVGISRFVFCPLFSSLVLLSVHCIVLPLLSKQHTHTYTHNALERRSHHFSSVKTHSPLLR